MSLKRARNIFDPLFPEPFKLSRTKIDSFIKCPRCFYLDRRLGISQPSGPGFSLNSAVDTLLKKEFDIHRAKGIAHPLMEHYGIDAVPLSHEKMDQWRHNFTGIQYLHPETNFLIYGAIDDIWKKRNGELIIVDYKSTSKAGEVTLDDEWKDGYKRQMEIYQWLFRKNGFKVSKTGYFVYANGDTDKEAFDGKLEFKIKLLPYEGDDSWVEGTIIKMKECLVSDTLPKRNPECEFCSYTSLVKEAEESVVKEKDLVLA